MFESVISLPGTFWYVVPLKVVGPVHTCVAVMAQRLPRYTALPLATVPTFAQPGLSSGAVVFPAPVSVSMITPWAAAGTSRAIAHEAAHALKRHNDVIRFTIGSPIPPIRCLPQKL